MNGLKTVGLGLIAAAAVVFVVGASLTPSPASAQEELIAIDSATMAPGDEVAVYLEALNIQEPGLGAWTVDISYDSTMLTAVACLPELGGVCNPMFDVGVVRITGASASGIAGDNALAAITFRCDAEGFTLLDLDVTLLVDATVGNPQSINAAVESGSITCATGAEAPTTPSADDVFDCEDLIYQDIAQAILDADPSDPNNLDADGDGIACEDLPQRSGSGVTGLPDVGAGPAGAPTAGRVLRWLSAAFAGVGLATMTTFGVLRLRARRVPTGRVRER